MNRVMPDRLLLLVLSSLFALASWSEEHGEIASDADDQHAEEPEEMVFRQHSRSAVYTMNPTSSKRCPKKQSRKSYSPPRHEIAPFSASQCGAKKTGLVKAMERPSKVRYLT